VWGRSGIQSWIGRNARAATLVAVGALGGGAAFAAASVPDENGAIHACVLASGGTTIPSSNPGVANIRIIDPSAGQSCAVAGGESTVSEIPLTFNASGPTGPAGAAGPTGANGSNGLPGAVGPTGAVGPVGPLGPAGPLGPVGAVGPAGPVGPAGGVGPPGAAGPAGAAGSNGSAGPVGPAGANGLNGLPGPVGSSSTTGGGGAQSVASDIFIRLRPASGPDIGPIAIDHVAFEATTSTSIGSASSGAGAGKVKFGALVLQKAIDPTSPVLFKALAAGEHFSQATVFVRVGRGVAQTDQREYRMSQVFVTRLAQDTTTTKADETIQLAFGAIQLVEFVQSPSGKSQGVIVGGWDQAKNTSFKPTTLLPAP